MSIGHDSDLGDCEMVSSCETFFQIRSGERLDRAVLVGYTVDEGVVELTAAVESEREEFLEVE